MSVFHVVPNDGVTVVAYLDDSDFPSREMAEAEIARLGLTATHHVMDGGLEDAQDEVFFPPQCNP